jgi:phospholipid/cholesterol/gamma-HCH transport system substrate-binding protein
MKNTARITGELAQFGASDDARNTLKNTKQFTSETLPEIQQLVTQLRDLTGSLQRISNELEQNPSMLLYGKQPAKRGPGE